MNQRTDQEVIMLSATYAGFWKRFAAYLFDKILISVVSLIIILPFIGVFGAGIGIVSMEGDEEEVLAVIIAALVSYAFIGILLMIMTWLYYALMESSRHQGTLGKMALGIYVTDIQGQRLTFGRATGRFFAKMISDLTFSIGYIIAGFTDKKQALHDMVASCLVVNREQS